MFKYKKSVPHNVYPVLDDPNSILGRVALGRTDVLVISKGYGASVAALTDLGGSTLRVRHTCMNSMN
jgi:hypothetical protein